VWWWVTIRGPLLHKILWKHSPSVPGRVSECNRTLGRLAGKDLRIQLIMNFFEEFKSLSSREARLDISGNHTIYEGCQNGDNGRTILRI
jgi:hypothetical protein